MEKGANKKKQKKTHQIMTAYFLDTSFIIDYLHGEKSSVQLMTSLEGKIVSSYFCLAELFEGVYRTGSKRAEKEAIGLFSGFSRIYELNQKIAKKFGELRNNLRKKGKLIEDIDIFIAATCLVYDLILVTNNKKHFRNVEGLKII